MICNCLKYDFKNQNYEYWESRKTTIDEVEIIKFLKKKFNPIKKNILHIGIGNSEFAKNFNKNNKITGITVSNNELYFAKSLKLQNYESYYCDKYTKDLSKITKSKKFDYIIDANLKSYSCYQKSFDYMIKTLIASLNVNGYIFTSRKGMKWYKKLYPKLTFSFKKFFYYKLKEDEGDRKNILSIKELHKIKKQYNLKISFNNKICYLKK